MSWLAEPIGDSAGAIQFSHQVEGGGPVFLEQAGKLGLEGMASKHADAL